MSLDAFSTISLQKFETARYEPALSGPYLMGKFKSTVK